MNKVLKHLFTDALFTVISSSVAILTLALLCVCVCVCVCVHVYVVKRFACNGHFPMGFYV